MESVTTIFLRKLPDGAPKESDFEFVTKSVSLKLSPGELLVEPLFISVDPYLRGRIPGWVGKPMNSGVVCRVLRSDNDKFRPGDTCVGRLPWATKVLVKGSLLKELTKVPSLPGVRISPSHFLGALGLTGQTAYYGLLDIGALKDGENVFVSGAAGATGSVVGQIAKLKGCRVVGTAGSQEKLGWLTQDLNFDAALNYKQFQTPKDAQQALAKAFPNGIDVYFDNTGGLITEAVWDLLNKDARVVVCGQIARYNKFNSVDKQESVGKIDDFLFKTIYRHVRIEGFVVWDCKDWSRFYHDMAQWIGEGKLQMRETVVNGFQNTPRAFIGMLAGKNVGKMVVNCGAPGAKL